MLADKRRRGAPSDSERHGKVMDEHNFRNLSGGLIAFRPCNKVAECVLCPCKAFMKQSVRVCSNAAYLAPCLIHVSAS